MSHISSYGTYTPTLTNVTNISASTAYLCQWNRIGTVVTVSGRVDIDQTTPGAIELGIEIPIPSNFTQNFQLAGTGEGVVGGDDPVWIDADVTNNRASFNAADTDASNHAHFFHFTYIIV